MLVLGLDFGSQLVSGASEEALRFIGIEWAWPDGGWGLLHLPEKRSSFREVHGGGGAN